MTQAELLCSHTGVLNVVRRNSRSYAKSLESMDASDLEQEFMLTLIRKQKAIDLNRRPLKLVKIIVSQWANNLVEAQNCQRRMPHPFNPYLGRTQNPLADRDGPDEGNPIENYEGVPQQIELGIDIRNALKQLPPLHREIAYALAEYNGVDIMEYFGITKYQLAGVKADIAGALQRLGFHGTPHGAFLPPLPTKELI